MIERMKKHQYIDYLNAISENYAIFPGENRANVIARVS